MERTPDLLKIVDEFNRWQNSRKVRYRFETQPLFHYTDANGLIGIIKSDKLWFTHIEHLNDPSEFRLSHDAAVEELRKALIEADSVVERFHTKMLGGLNKALRNVSQYVASFSCHGDDLGQWRSYADNGRGFCLEISEQVFADSALNEDPLKNHVRIAVSYDAELARQELQEGMHHVIELLKHIDRRDREPDACKKIFVKLSVALARWIYFISALFKHPAYACEREVRLLLINSAARLQPHVEVRARNGEIVPYIPWPFQPSLRQEGVLQRIRIGPTAPQNAENALTELLRSCGISSPPVVICRSQIPYRAI